MRRPWRRARPVRANGGRRAQGHEPGSWPPAPPAGVRRTGPPARAMASAAQEGRPYNTNPAHSTGSERSSGGRSVKSSKRRLFFLPGAAHVPASHGRPKRRRGRPLAAPRAGGRRQARPGTTCANDAGRPHRKAQIPPSETIVVGQTLALDGMAARAARAVAGSAADQQGVVEDLRSLRSAAVSSGIE